MLTPVRGPCPFWRGDIRSAAGGEHILRCETGLHRSASEACRSEFAGADRAASEMCRRDNFAYSPLSADLSVAGATPFVGRSPASSIGRVFAGCGLEIGRGGCLVGGSHHIGSVSGEIEHVLHACDIVGVETAEYSTSGAFSVVKLQLSWARAALRFLEFVAMRPKGGSTSSTLSMTAAVALARSQTTWVAVLVASSKWVSTLGTRRASRRACATARIASSRIASATLLLLSFACASRPATEPRCDARRQAAPLHPHACCRARTKAAPSLSTPKRRRIGCAQWWPARTAIPSRSSALPTSSARQPSTRNETTPARSRGCADQPHAGNASQTRHGRLDQFVLVRARSPPCRCGRDSRSPRQAHGVGDVAGAGLEAFRRGLIERALEGDVGDHVAAALPGRHGVEHRLLAVDHADARRARTSCGPRARRSRRRAPARRCACARPIARRRPAPARRGDAPTAIISRAGVTVPSALETVRQRDDAGARVEELLIFVEPDVAVIVDRRDAQLRAGRGAKLLPGHDIGVVLQLGDDDLVAGPARCGGPSSARRD